MVAFPLNAALASAFAVSSLFRCWWTRTGWTAANYQLRQEEKSTMTRVLGYDQGKANKLDELLRQSRERKNTSEEQEAQRRSFAYGNTHFENNRITRETVDSAAEDLKRDEKNRHPAR
jgi:hypothetical protein